VAIVADACAPETRPADIDRNKLRPRLLVVLADAGTAADTRTAE
jgi:hypothetical protein